ncbi:MAG: ABC transporter permease [Candidatus Phytoplasma stylosanthis]|nr:ABC transporter permease [Candidatus Phytoplasma stylosanthis]
MHDFYNYIFKKIIYIFLLLITVIIVSFFSLKMIPGDPVSSFFGSKQPSPEERKICEKKLGLDKSLDEQFKIYLKNIFKLDFGNSYRGDHKKSLILFWNSFKLTFLLVFFSCIFGSLIGIFFGSLGALWKNTKKSFILDLIFLFLFSTPTFIIGFTLQYFLAYHFKFFPISGFNDIQSLFLPILTLSLVMASSLFKITYNNMVEILKQPYILTAYAKGLSKWTVLFKHSLKNALIPILAQIGLILSSFISGTIITEYTFNLNGIGKLIIRSFQDRDFPVLQCCIILLAVFISIFNLLLDFLYFWLNPKINFKKNII